MEETPSALCKTQEENLKLLTEQEAPFVGGEFKQTRMSQIKRVDSDSLKHRFQTGVVLDFLLDFQ